MHALPPKHAAGYILQTIRTRIHGGQDAISYMEISVASGYSLPTVQAAVAKLQQLEYLRVQRQRAGRPNRYEIIAEEQRRVRAVARFINLIK